MGIAFRVAAALVLSATTALPVLAQTKITNYSYDVMRDFYKDFNPAFVKYWKTTTGETVEVQQSHAASTKQARSVIDGAEADVLTMNQLPDVLMVAANGLIPQDWATRLPDQSVPFTSSSVFIVRQGNPKNIKDWSDLIRDDVKVVIPTPKITGNGRYTYLSAWAWAQTQPGGSAEKARAYVAELFNKHVPIMPPGGRAATTTFLQQGIGDVLVTFENEAELLAKEFGKGKFENIYPSLSVIAEPPVTVVDRVVDKRGSRKLAQAYLEYLWSPEGQELAAKNYLRPRNAEVLKKYAAQFPSVNTIAVEAVFGSWSDAMKTHFADGGVFDSLYQPQK
jgi:sulfate transport system substrate-binding protein